MPLGAYWGLLGATLGPFWLNLGAILGSECTPTRNFNFPLCSTIPGPAECAKRSNPPTPLAVGDDDDDEDSDENSDDDGDSDDGDDTDESSRRHRRL